MDGAASGSERRHEVVIRMLLDKEADANVQNKYGWTALHWAAGNGHEAIVNILQN